MHFVYYKMQLIIGLKGRLVIVAQFHIIKLKLRDFT